MSKTLGVVFSIVVLAILGTGCGSECGDLQDICDTCSGDTKTRCEEIAEADEDNACTDAVAEFDPICEEAEE